jgi:hypothetical protein
MCGIRSLRRARPFAVTFPPSTRLGSVLGEELALLDLERLVGRRELLLEPEDDVEVVDRLGAEIAGKGGVGGDILGVDPKGFLKYFLHVGLDLIASLHESSGDRLSKERRAES